MLRLIDGVDGCLYAREVLSDPRDIFGGESAHHQYPRVCSIATLQRDAGFEEASIK